MFGGVIVELFTERLIITEYEASDYVDLYEMLSDKDTAYNLGFKPIYNVNVAKQITSLRVVNQEFYKILTKNLVFIGDINLFQDKTRMNTEAYQLGFCLKKEYRHQGYMIEALKCFLSKVLDLDFNILSLNVMPSNVDSIKLIEKLGFKYQGIRRNYKKMYDDKLVDAFEYSLTKDELKEIIKLWQKN